MKASAAALRRRPGVRRTRARPRCASCSSNVRRSLRRPACACRRFRTRQRNSSASAISVRLARHEDAESHELRPVPGSSRDRSADAEPRARDPARAVEVAEPARRRSSRRARAGRPTRRSDRAAPRPLPRGDRRGRATPPPRRDPRRRERAARARSPRSRARWRRSSRAVADVRSVCARLSSSAWPMTWWPTSMPTSHSG